MNTIDLIKTQVKNEEITGIIPINPKRLKIHFANKSLAPGIAERLVIFLICFLPALFIYSFFAFILGDMGVSKLSLIFLLILIIGAFMFIAESIYVNNIKKYPEVYLVLTNSDLHFISIRNQNIEIYHTFDINVNELNKVFYGEFNRKQQRIGEHFEIRKNDQRLLSGKINIEGNTLKSYIIPEKYLLAEKKLRKIYISKN